MLHFTLTRLEQKQFGKSHDIRLQVRNQQNTKTNIKTKPTPQKGQSKKVTTITKST
uniref:Uncharacterized protein n=1 Tax=Rhizophora mucronata TaxID=61149 RepID=A0A2P2N0A1_RHIMU